MFRPLFRCCLSLTCRKSPAWESCAKTARSAGTARRSQKPPPAEPRDTRPDWLAERGCDMSRKRRRLPKAVIEELKLDRTWRAHFAKSAAYNKRRRRRREETIAAVAVLFPTNPTCHTCGRELSLVRGSRNQAIVSAVDSTRLQCPQCKSECCSARAVA